MGLGKVVEGKSSAAGRQSPPWSRGWCSCSKRIHILDIFSFSSIIKPTPPSPIHLLCLPPITQDSQGVPLSPSSTPCTSPPPPPYSRSYTTILWQTSAKLSPDELINLPNSCWLVRWSSQDWGNFPILWKPSAAAHPPHLPLHVSQALHHGHGADSEPFTLVEWSSLT